MPTYQKIIFPKQNTIFDTTSAYDLSQLFMKWRKTNMSIETLADTAISHFDLNTTAPDLANVLQDISTIADKPHNIPFHNNHHFREVFASTMRICHVHQQTSASKLSTDSISKCLIAAVAHDLNHDGTSNNAQRKHIPFRLEDIAFNALLPVLKTHNINAKDTQDIHTIIRTTDMSSDGTHKSPNALLRETYAEGNTYLPASISTIHHDKNLQDMAAIVADADMTPTMGTTPEYSIYMSACFCKEQQIMCAPEKDNAQFLLNGPKGFITPAAQKLSTVAYNDMVARIPKKYTRAQTKSRLKP